MTQSLLASVLILFMELFLGVILTVYTLSSNWDEAEFDQLPMLIRILLWSSLALLAISGLTWLVAGVVLAGGNSSAWIADVMEGFIGVCEAFSVFALAEATKWRRRKL